MLEKVQVMTTEKDEGTMNIIRTLLEIYPYGGIMKEFIKNGTTRFILITQRKNLKLLRYDLLLLRKCGFDVEEIKA